MEAEIGLVGVSGCRLAVKRCGSGSSCIAGCVAGCVAGWVGVGTVRVSQTAFNSELQQFVITQVTVDRIILKAQTGSC